MFKKKKWIVEYLECYGVSSVYNVEEIYYARTKRGVYKQFLEEHICLPTGYTDRSHFETFYAFKRLVREGKDV